MSGKAGFINDRVARQARVEQIIREAQAMGPSQTGTIFRSQGGFRPILKDMGMAVRVCLKCHRTEAEHAAAPDHPFTP